MLSVESMFSPAGFKENTKKGVSKSVKGQTKTKMLHLKGHVGCFCTILFGYILPLLITVFQNLINCIHGYAATIVTKK